MSIQMPFLLLHLLFFLCTTLFLCPTICAIAVKANEKDERSQPHRLAWDSEHREEEEEEGEEDKTMAKVDKLVMAPNEQRPHFWPAERRSEWGEQEQRDGEEEEETMADPTYQRTNKVTTDVQHQTENGLLLNVLRPWGDGGGRGMIVDVDIAKDRRNGLWMKKRDNLVEEEQWKEEGAQRTGPRLMIIPSHALSLVPKRRRRIGTAGGGQIKENAIRKSAKMAKILVPTTFPDSGGIELNVQSDFVEKNDVETTTTEGQKKEKEKEEKKSEGKEREKEEKETEKGKGKEKEKEKDGKEEENGVSRRKGNETSEGKQRRGADNGTLTGGNEGERKQRRGADNGTLTGGNEGERKQRRGADNGTLTEGGRDFWANALRTLLIEFRKMHPELIRGRGGGGGKGANQQQVEGRTAQQSDEAKSSNRTIKNNGRTETPEEREGEKRGTTTDNWKGTDNRLEDK